MDFMSFHISPGFHPGFCLSAVEGLILQSTLEIHFFFPLSEAEGEVERGNEAISRSYFKTFSRTPAAPNISRAQRNLDNDSKKNRELFLLVLYVSLKINFKHIYYLENQLAFHPKFLRLIVCRFSFCLCHPIV